MTAILKNIGFACAALVGVFLLGIYRFSGDMSEMVDECPIHGEATFCECLEATVKADVGYIQGGLWRTGLYNAATGGQGVEKIAAASVNAAQICEATG
jgi:hypothetical protein